MVAELMNCESCGALYVKVIRDVCDSCYREAEERFERVYSFVRKKENRKATIVETAEATNVSEREILDYVRMGRLHLSSLPNFSWECHFCSAPIRNGKLCSNCEKQFAKELADDMKVEDNERNLTYYVKNEYGERGGRR